MRIWRSPYFLLVLVFLLAVIIRSYRFGSIPSGVNRDEASIGYTAYLLLHTGQEEHQQFWPARFESFGDWKQPGYIYLTMPLIWLFGLSAISVRLLSLTAGMVMIMVAYLLTNQLAGQPYGRWAGVLAALLMALNPWHFHFSHLAVEALVSATWFYSGIYLLIMPTLRRQLLGLGALLGSMLTYHAALIVVPLWFIWFVVSMRKKRVSWMVKLLWIAFGIITVIWLSQAWFSSERAKVTGTTIFSMTSAEKWQAIYQYRSGAVISKITNNQYLYWVKTFTSNYAKTWSPQFLFFQGGSHPHYNVPGYGNFWIIEIILLSIGLIWVIKKRSRLGWWLLVALLLAPIPAAITKDGVHSTREIFMLPAIQILAAAGAMFLIKKSGSTKKRAAVMLTIMLALLIQAVPFYRYYWSDYPVLSDERFSGYMKEVSLYTKNQLDKYPSIYVTYPFESPYMFYAFYNQLNPKEFLESVSYFPTDQLGFKYAKSLGKIEYLANNRDLLNLPADQLAPALVFSRIEAGQGIKPVKIWYNRAGRPEIMAFEGSQMKR